jgi:hypothetical protein
MARPPRRTHLRGVLRTLASLLWLASAEPPPGATSCDERAPDPRHEGLTVTGIQVQVEGVRRTREGAVLRLMDTRVGRPFRQGVLARDLNRLRVTQMISEACADVTATDGGLVLALRVRDRWSTFLYAGTRRGGARTITRLGVFDHNVLGRLHRVWVELNSGADVPFVAESSGDRIGTSLHAVLPRLLGGRLTPMGQWTREFFDFSALDGDGEPGFIYDRERRLFQLGLRYDLARPVALTAAARTFEDRFAANSLSRAPGRLPPGGRTSSLLVEAVFGEIEERLARFEGQELTLAAEGSLGGLGSDRTILAASARARAFAVPRPGHVSGAQLVATATTGREDSHLPRAGGLFEIRGFLDGTFVARRIAYANLEHRVELWEPRRPFRMIVQGVAFLDLGAVSGRARAVAGLDHEGLVASAGGGLRVNLVPLARAVARVDLAFGLHPLRRTDVALGVQQFF